MTKRDAYARIEAQLPRLLEDGPDLVAAMATAAALLKDNLTHVFWVGFYLPEEDGSLRVGPYQGPLACLRLPPGQGVCGTVARDRKTRVVADVDAFPGHISCDARAKSEVVVPVVRDGELLAVLDVDSTEKAAFDDGDARALEGVAAVIAALARS